MGSEFQVPSLYERLGGREGLLRLLRHFYADVRQHGLIGPVFASKISDWPKHLETIADFWSAATGGPMEYAGAMPWKHLSLGIDERHFEAWLDLWRRHCRIQLKPQEAADLIALAETVGMRLRGILSAHGGRERIL
ncbi:MAG: truncated hemoglobin [Opitutaceae bacterium]